MNSLDEEIDLNRELISAELEELDKEIEELEHRISVLTNELRYKRIHKYDLEYRLKEMYNEYINVPSDNLMNKKQQ
jgi:predicted nuclease with TOPRIM domain